MYSDFENGMLGSSMASLFGTSSTLQTVLELAPEPPEQVEQEQRGVSGSVYISTKVPYSQRYVSWNKIKELTKHLDIML